MRHTIVSEHGRDVLVDTDSGKLVSAASGVVALVTQETRRPVRGIHLTISDEASTRVVSIPHLTLSQVRQMLGDDIWYQRRAWSLGAGHVRFEYSIVHNHSILRQYCTLEHQQAL